MGSVTISCSYWQLIGEIPRLKISIIENLWSVTKEVGNIHRAEDLDSAILDRCDESLMFPLPDDDCRYKLIVQNFDYYVRRMDCRPLSLRNTLLISIQNMIRKNPKNVTKIVDDDAMDESQIRETVRLTSGFSGREIGKLMIAIQGSIHSSETGKLSRRYCQKIVDTKVEEHNEKVKMKQPH